MNSDRGSILTDILSSLLEKLVSREAQMNLELALNFLSYITRYV